MKMYLGFREPGAVYSVVVREIGAADYPLASPGEEQPGFRWGYAGPATDHLAGCILLDWLGWVKGARRSDLDIPRFGQARAMLRDILAKAPMDWFQVTAKEVRGAWKAAGRIPRISTEDIKAQVDARRAGAQPMTMPAEKPTRLDEVLPLPDSGVIARHRIRGKV